MPIPWRESLQRPAARNLGWLVIERLVRLVLSVVVGFLVARYLGPAQFGRLSWVLAVVGIGVAVAEAGLSAIARREMLRAPGQAPGVLAGST